MNDVLIIGREGARRMPRMIVCENQLTEHKSPPRHWCLNFMWSVWNFSWNHSNLFPFDAVNLAAGEFVPIAVNFAERRRVFRHRWWHHGSCGNRRLVMCFVNTVNGRGVARLECWHVGAGRGEDRFGRWHRRWTRWRRRTHCESFFCTACFWFFLDSLTN